MARNSELGESQLAKARDAMEKALVVELGLRAELNVAQGKLSRIETDMCTCNRGLVGMCIAHDKNSLLARILKEEK